MKVLGVIPARGGSKGVARKNLRELGGRPLLAWTAQAALSASRFSRVVLSTDDDEIAEVGRSLGLDVPFRRPSELATDAARAIPVIQHALGEVERLDSNTYEVAVLLQPTTPFRTAADLDGAIELLEASAADSVISVVAVGGHHPARMKYLEGDRLLDPPFCEAFENQPRQELREMYIRNGAIYATRSSVIRLGSFKGTDCRAWIMPPERSVNIDTELDFEYAQWLLSRSR